MKAKQRPLPSHTPKCSSVCPRSCCSFLEKNYGYLVRNRCGLSKRYHYYFEYSWKNNVRISGFQTGYVTDTDVTLMSSPNIIQISKSLAMSDQYQWREFLLLNPTSLIQFTGLDLLICLISSFLLYDDTSYMMTDVKRN